MSVVAGRLKLSDAQLWTAINALRVAANVYRDDAGVDPNLEAQFRNQATAADLLADLLEDAE